MSQKLNVAIAVIGIDIVINEGPAEVAQGNAAGDALASFLV